MMSVVKWVEMTRGYDAHEGHICLTSDANRCEKGNGRRSRKRLRKQMQVRMWVLLPYSYI